MSTQSKPFSDAGLLRAGFKFVESYLYPDRDGTLLYEKRRYHRSNGEGYEKTFLIRRPNGKGVWLAEMGDQRVLYRQQNILAAAPGEPCYINEGEKACERCAKLNLLSTCVAANWDDVDLEPLRGRPCFVIRDDDQGGTDKNADAKARAAATALIGIASSVRIVDLPGLPPGGDVVDWLDANDDDVAALLDLCQAAPEYRAQPQDSEVTLQWECMADIEPEPIDWIWPGRLARGKLTLIAGDPGMGKSQIGLDVAARITTADTFHDKSKSPLGSVLILTAEDAANDTVRPRCEGAGADLKRVHRLKAAITKDGTVTTFHLQEDLAALTTKLNAVGDVALVIIDPITSYMGSKIDAHHNTAVRAVLEPLAVWAEQHHVAVLGITHPPKSAPAKALHAIIGSIAFVAAARIVFLAIKEPDGKRSLLLAVKNNLGALADGLGYFLEQTIISKGIVASRVAWDNSAVSISADEALAATTRKDAPALNEGKEFLRQELADGPRAQKEIEEDAKGAGITMSTVRRAQKALRIKPRKDGLAGGWIWQLPEETSPATPDAANDILARAQRNDAAGEPRFRVIGDCEAQTICLQCQKTGNVKRIKDASRPGSQSETLHETCAEAWFER
jgi:hypothetical protein